MSNETESTSTEESTTTSTTESTESTESTSTETKTVSKEAYEKVMADMHKYKKQLKEFEAKNREAELKVLKEKQEWQKIAELKEQEAREALEQKERMTKAIVTDKKLSAIREAALKHGVLESALEDMDFLDWSGVQVETTSTGRINVIGVEDAVKRVKTLKPHWFGKPAPKINGKVPETKGTDGIVTVEKLNKLRKEAMKSGDYSAYEPAFRAFQAQQANSK